MNEHAPIGHNAPPTEAHDPEIYEKLDAGVERFNEASAEWMALKELDSDAQSQSLTDFIAGARQLRNTVEKNRKEQKGKWDALGKEVQAAYTKLLNRIAEIEKHPKALQSDWLRKKKAEEDARRAEAQRKAREEAERAEELRRQAEARNDAAGMADADAARELAEKAEKAASKPSSVKAGSASGGTRSMGLRTVKTAKVKSLAKLFTHYRDHPDVEATLVRLANADLRSPDVDDASIPGIEIITEERVA